jgi:hypothetical protein
LSLGKVLVSPGASVPPIDWCWLLVIEHICQPVRSICLSALA